MIASRVAPLLGLAAALSLAGCTDAGSRPSATDRPAAAGAPTPAAATTGTPPDGSPRPSPSSSSAEVTIPLHSDGVGAVYLGLPQAQARVALEALLGPPDSERVSFCELQQTEAESKDRTLRWDDLLIGLSEQAGGSVTFDTWAARGPDLPAGVVFPYGITPGVDTEAELLRVDAVEVNSELEDRIGPGWYMRGALEWNVDTEVPGSPVTGVYVGATTCD